MSDGLRPNSAAAVRVSLATSASTVASVATKRARPPDDRGGPSDATRRATALPIPEVPP